MDREELLWRQYELNIKMYRDYLGLVLKTNVLYYAITGAILSYYFSHPEQSLAKYALLLPLVMSLALSTLFFIGSYLAKYTRAETFALQDALKLMVAPEIGVLMLLLVILGSLMLMVAAGLIYLVFIK
jgi:hypothetical protein